MRHLLKRLHAEADKMRRSTGGSAENQKYDDAYGAGMLRVIRAVEGWLDKNGKEGGDGGVQR